MAGSYPDGGAHAPSPERDANQVIDSLAESWKLFTAHTLDDDLPLIFLFGFRGCHRKNYLLLFHQDDRYCIGGVQENKTSEKVTVIEFYQHCGIKFKSGGKLRSQW